MERVRVILHIPDGDDRREIAKALRGMSFDDTVVSGDDAPVLEIDPGAYNQPLYKKADSAIEHARLRAHDIVRGAKEIAERPEAYVELKIPMWPGMG